MKQRDTMISLQVSRTQYETVVRPGVGDHQRVKNEQTAYSDFLCMTKLCQEKQMKAPS